MATLIPIPAAAYLAESAGGSAQMSDVAGGSGTADDAVGVGPRATAAVVVAVAFVVGGLAGAALFREFGHGEREGRSRILPGMKLAPAPTEAAGEGSEPGEASERALARFARALQLTPAQAAAVDSISMHEFEAANAVREESWPRMQEVLGDTRRQHRQHAHTRPARAVSRDAREAGGALAARTGPPRGRVQGDRGEQSLQGQAAVIARPSWY